MKTKLLGGIFALAVMVATGYGVNRSMQKDTDLSEMAIKNIEALAAGNVSGDCRTTKEGTKTYCLYRCCACAALHQSTGHGDILVSVSGVCSVCGTPVSSCK